MHRNMEVNFILKTLPESVEPDRHFWHLRCSEGMPCLPKPSVAPGSWFVFFFFSIMHSAEAAHFYSCCELN